MGRCSLFATLLLILAACAPQVNPVVIDCPRWPTEGTLAYQEIQQACGGESMPNCPWHKDWRGRLRNLKDQLDVCAPKELS